jgi:protein-tyrosine phosphatase
MNRIDELDFYSLNKSKYILIEFSPSNFPNNIEDIIYEFKIRNYMPILAHVERYEKIVNDINNIYEYINAGALIQINVSSITGKSGKQIQNICDILIRNNMVYFVATDAHSSNSRNPILNKAYEYIKDKIGKEKSKEIFYENPQKLILNQEIIIKQPIKYKQSKLKRIIKNIMEETIELRSILIL